MEQWIDQVLANAEASAAQLANPHTYIQLAIIAAGVLLALALAAFVRASVKAAEAKLPDEGFAALRGALTGVRILAVPAMLALVLSVARSFSVDVAGQMWLVRAAQGIALIALIYGLVSLVARRSAFVAVLKWIGVVLALLHIFGWLDDVTGYLESVKLSAGNITITLYAVARTILFGIVLFWLGRLSNDTGQRVIRERTNFDAGAREVMAKLFQIAVYSLIVVLLLNVMGVDLTALTVFGGAVGIGIGVGLQAIASNFISGLIILLDRSVTIGDFVELEDGRKGRIRELNIRSATLETFDGKDIMVPNEKFITTTFVNWTHDHKRQRYDLRFQVAYATDLEKLFEIVRETVASHPKVLSGEDIPFALRPDAEIAGFGDSGVDILVEFWMEGIDDGENRVGADLMLMIWTALKAGGIEIPFPQREVRVLGEVKTGK